MKDLFTTSAFMFYMTAIVSMILHAIKKWVDGEVEGSLFNWYLNNRKRTYAALMACIGSVAGAILGGVLTDYTQAAQILACAGMGFAADTLNKQGGPQ